MVDRSLPPDQHGEVPGPREVNRSGGSVDERRRRVVGEPVEPSGGCAVHSHDEADTVGSPAGEGLARVLDGNRVHLLAVMVTATLNHASLN